MFMYGFGIFIDWFGCKIIFCLGLFYIVMSFLESIGYLMDGVGLK